MDEVEAMAHAGEMVGETMGKGLRAVRVGATKASHAGAEASSRVARLVEQRVTDGGVAALGDQIKRRGGKRVSARKARKALRRKRKELAKTTQRLGEKLAEQIEPRRRRRWPWLLALLIVGAAAASVMSARRPAEVSLTTGEDEEMPVKEAEQAQRDKLADQS